MLGSSLVARPRVTEPIELWSSDIYLLRILFFFFCVPLDSMESSEESSLEIVIYVVFLPKYLQFQFR